MEIEANYVDTHGQSFIGFGVTRLLGFDLLPRIKQINRRGLIPLFTMNMTPDSEIQLNLDRRLNLATDRRPQHLTAFGQPFGSVGCRPRTDLVVLVGHDGLVEWSAKRNSVRSWPAVRADATACGNASGGG